MEPTSLSPGLRPRWRMRTLLRDSTAFGVALWLMTSIGQTASADQLPIIDTHVHFETTQRHANFSGDAEDAIAQMNAHSVQMSFVMPPPEGLARVSSYDLDSLKFVVNRYPGRFAVLGGAGTLGRMIWKTDPGSVSDRDRKAFSDLAKNIIESNAVGFGEIGIEHFSLPAMGPKHPFEATAPDHPLLLLLADIAADNKMPIDIHFDVIPAETDLPPPLKSPPNPARLHENLSGFERLLAHNSNAKFVWAHVGGEPARMRTVELCRRLLTLYPNLYMSFRVERGLPDPTWALGPDGSLKPMWRKLILDFPDRFVLGSDSFYTDEPGTRRGGKAAGLDNFQRLLAQLPPDIAIKLARDNVKSIYRLPAN